MPEKEAKARIKINQLLEEAGWRLVDSKLGRANVLLEATTHITKHKLDELGDDFEHTANGYVDFLLHDDNGYPAVVLEAKAENRNPLVGKEQARRYALANKCRFVILSNGNCHYFWDTEGCNPTMVTQFPSPAAITSRRQHHPDVTALAHEPVEPDYIAITKMPGYQRNPDWLNPQTRDEFLFKNKLRLLRPYQLDAVKALQKAADAGQQRFLFEMATGTGKTLVAAAVIKLFLRTRNARRVLFLVDRLELEDQAFKSFKMLLSADFDTMIYKQNVDNWRGAEIVVSTVQTLMVNNKYRRVFSPDDFDLVISDEAHRSISGNSRAVFDFFLGYKLGLTATPRDYLKHIDQAKLSENDPRELERRMLMDSYKTFGCEDGEPTFRYSLLDGVKEGHLVNPEVLDARTEITTQLLSDEGYAAILPADEGEESQEQIYKYQDFERRFFNEQTNRVFCTAFMQNALRDPITGEIGKSIVFCVSQNHAAKITQMLNEIAHAMFPGRYQSDFAVQVTSQITDAQQMSINFANDKLGGRSKFDENYKTSKTRVCVTVGMMTTGYDCPDLLNLGLMRPIFSPTAFIQIKGRGTRIHEFSKMILDETLRKQVGSKPKSCFRLFDFFANCEYFEEKFDYDQVLVLPRVGNGEPIDPRASVGEPKGIYQADKADGISTLSTTMVGEDGMRIDRMYFQKFEEQITADPTCVEKADNAQWDELLDYVEKNLMDRPEQFFTLQKLRAALQVDRRIDLMEIIKKIFGLIPEFKTRRQMIDEAFDRFDSRYRPDEGYFEAAKQVFCAYIQDAKFRQIVESRQYATMNMTPYAQAWRSLSPDLRKHIPEFVKDNLSLNQFMD